MESRRERPLCQTACKEAALGIGGIVAAPGAAVGNPFEGRIDEVRISNVVRRNRGGLERRPLSTG